MAANTETTSPAADDGRAFVTSHTTHLGTPVTGWGLSRVWCPRCRLPHPAIPYLPCRYCRLRDELGDDAYEELQRAWGDEIADHWAGASACCANRYCSGCTVTNSLSPQDSDRMRAHLSRLLERHPMHRKPTP
jgi:hypothetical protein